MDATALSQLLTSLANGVTAFAALQNLAYAYHLAKRESRIVINRDRKRWLLGGTCVFNLMYLSSVWWLSHSAVEVLGTTSPPTTAEVLSALTYGRCMAVFVLSLVPTYLVWRYDDPHYWIREAGGVGAGRVPV